MLFDARRGWGFEQEQISDFRLHSFTVLHEQTVILYINHDGLFFAFFYHIFVWSSLCFWKSLFLEPSRISNSITVRRKIAVKISMLSVVFQSNMTVWGQTDLWIVSNQPERPGGSDGHDLTSYLPLWSMLNSFVSFCPTIVVLILAWILKLMVWKTVTLSSKVARFFTCAGQMTMLRLLRFLWFQCFRDTWPFYCCFHRIKSFYSWTQYS